ncbi:hypothetical protein NIES4102_08940 [Chondrocystis sp. NIES-4102]|nr:hypothetical protein NIES4102_08940 [Chondrocystis sp. NIES-4102]
MNKKELHKLLKKNKSNTGFTLIELLVGLFMSVFVIGALGFGLMQVLRVTQLEGSKTAARGETGRALDFISDELRRAQAVEVDLSDANITAVAPAYNTNPLTGGSVKLALNIPGVSQRVIYSVAPPQPTSPWKGPLVIYRWGPELRADGSYVTDSTKSGRVDNPDGWTKEALIDKVDDTEQTANCGGTNVQFQGLFACAIDDDGDGLVENATDVNGDGVIDSRDTGVRDLNGDGRINDQDGADTDRRAITAQLFFGTGENLTASGIDTRYAANTQAVTRARNAPESTSQALVSYAWSMRGLGGGYTCKESAPTSLTTSPPPIDWDMRTDFDNGNMPISWLQGRDQNRQARPIDINPNNPLTITSNPVNAANCASSDIPVAHTIDFGDPITFNGDNEDDPNANNPLVKGTTDQTVQFFKKNYDIPDIGGYYGNPDTTADDQPSLGKFLYDQGVAIPIGGGDPNNPATRFRIPKDQAEMDAYLNASSLSAADKNKFTVLGDDERIIAFEVGQKYPDRTNDGTPITGGKNTGFDLQDNIFIVKSDIFKKKFKSDCFGGSGCS